MYYDAQLPSDDQTVQALSFFFGEDAVRPHMVPEFATTGEAALEVVLGDNYSTIFD